MRSLRQIITEQKKMLVVVTGRSEQCYRARASTRGPQPSRSRKTHIIQRWTEISISRYNRLSSWFQINCNLRGWKELLGMFALWSAVVHRELCSGRCRRGLHLGIYTHHRGRLAQSWLQWDEVAGTIASSLLHGKNPRASDLIEEWQPCLTLQLADELRY